ncbi:SGNH/GDSL hydrolase family protein [Nonomuraea rhizosphaerae]|uniref:SGNH/GDSL hydrolase family protein n=1 Tax=Nonomuraea rhizosphaerae TaxID=2665663 RepID=UPI0027E37A9B|nr:SGNH/GDSL hydrolase family protein [Nonomuraea rhizosphaerae]
MVAALARTAPCLGEVALDGASQATSGVGPDVTPDTASGTAPDVTSGTTSGGTPDNVRGTPLSTLLGTSLGALGWVVRRRAVQIGAAAALGAALAVASVPLGLSASVACLAGCPADRVPAGLLPVAARLSPVQVAQSGAYVGLGDSYSSGEGVYDGDARLPADGGDRCHRSQGSYVPLVAGAHSFGGGTAFWACSGATTRQLFSGQYGQQPQLQRVAASATLVTLSIGGNDAGFTRVLTGCIVKLPWSSACVDQDAEVAERIRRLGPSMTKVLRELRARAPLARVIVLGYPRPFPAVPVKSVANLTVQDQRWLNGVTRELNDVVGRVAADFDRGIAALGGTGSVEYVDAYDAFDGHEVGQPDPYVNGLAVNLEELTVNARSFHPTGAGYRRFAELVNARIAAGPGRPMNNFKLTKP